MTASRLRNYGRAALVGVTVALLLLPFAETGRELANSDWTPIYIGGRLVVLNPGHLYDRGVQLAAQQTLLGPGGFSAPGQGALLPYVFPPWVALLAAPFTALGLEWGGRAWILLNSAALLGGLLLVARDRWAAVAAFAGVPAALAVSNAQADGLVVLGLGLAWHWHRAQRELLAGLTLALTLAKPHLVVAVWVAVLLARRWRALAGAMAGAALLVAAAEVRDASLVPAWLHSLTAIAGRSPLEVGLPAIAWAFAPALAPAAAALATAAALGLARRPPKDPLRYGTLLVSSLVAALHALGSDVVLASAGLAAAGRARRLPLLLLSAGALAYALAHQPLVAAAFSLGLAALAVWLSGQRDEQAGAPGDDG